MLLWSRTRVFFPVPSRSRKSHFRSREYYSLSRHFWEFTTLVQLETRMSRLVFEIKGDSKITGHSKITCGQMSALAWAPTGMGKTGHLLPSGNVVKCFCASVVIAKRSVEELFTHHFHNLLLTSWSSTTRHPLGLHPWTPLGIFVPRPLICPPLEKILRAPIRFGRHFLTCLQNAST